MELTHGAANLIRHFGSRELRDRYLDIVINYEEIQEAVYEINSVYETFMMALGLRGESFKESGGSLQGKSSPNSVTEDLSAARLQRFK